MAVLLLAMASKSAAQTCKFLSKPITNWPAECYVSDEHADWVEVTLQLGNQKFEVANCLGMSVSYEFTNIDFHDGAVAEILAADGWLTADFLYSSSIAVDPSSNRISMMIARDSCMKVTGTGQALKLRIHNATRVMGKPVQVLRLGGIVIEDIINLRPTEHATQRSYSEFLQNYFEGQTQEIMDPEELTPPSVVLQLRSTVCEDGHQLTVHMNGALSGMLYIYDLSGTMLKAVPVHHAAAVDVDISDLSQGIYVTRIDDGGLTLYSRFMKF